MVGGKTCYYISNVVLLLSRLICYYGVALINFHNLFSKMKKKTFFSNPKSMNLVSDGSYIKTKHACHAFVRPFQINSLVCTKLIILKFRLRLFVFYLNEMPVTKARGHNVPCIAVMLCKVIYCSM